MRLLVKNKVWGANNPKTSLYMYIQLTIRMWQKQKIYLFQISLFDLVAIIKGINRDDQMIF